MNKLIKLGSFVEDVLTEISGTVIAKTLWIYGCSRLVVQPSEVKDGKLAESIGLEEKTVKLSKKEARIDEIEVDFGSFRVGLGDEVKDIITGFTGIVVAQTMWISGCRRLTVTSRKLHDGRPIPNHTFDEPQLKVVKENAIPSEVSVSVEKPPHGDDYPDPVREPDPVR